MVEDEDCVFDSGGEEEVEETDCKRGDDRGDESGEGGKEEDDGAAVNDSVESNPLLELDEPFGESQQLFNPRYPCDELYYDNDA